MARGRQSSVSGYRGAEGRRKAEEEQKRQKERAAQRKEQGNMPFRFRVKDGDTTQFVVLDDEPDFFRFEHNLKNPQTGFWDIYTGCVNEFDNCPVCQATGREAYYALYLTVLDLTEFKDKDGNINEFSRKLLVVKPAQQKKFLRAFSKAEQDGRTLRGTIFETTRDSDKDSAIGNDIEVIDVMEEDELSTYKRTWKDRDGKKHTEDCSEVYDYEKLFPEATTEELRRMVGAGPGFGSREEEDRNLGRSSGRSSGRRSSRREEQDADEDDYEKPALNKRTRKARDEDDDDDVEESRTSRRSRRAAAKDEDEVEERSTRGRSRRASKDEEDDDPPFDADDDDADDDDSGSRARGRGRSSAREDRKAPGVGRRITSRGRR